jgi:DNA-binding FadR family transcriptional regulator
MEISGLPQGPEGGEETMPTSAGDAGLDPPALRPQDWRRSAPADLRPGPRLSRGEAAAVQLIALAEATPSGGRMGSREELRARCEVSVGTFNEAMRIAQSRGIITVRPGPGGGVFAADQSPLVRLGNSVLALDARATPVAEAVRIRDALDPLLIEDALWHASPADIAAMREVLADMATAAAAQQPEEFVRANWALHARIAAVSPHAMLRSLYVNLLEVIESHTLAVLPDTERPLPEYIADRLGLHIALVDALDQRDRDRALELIERHRTSDTPTAGAVPAGTVAASPVPASTVPASTVPASPVPASTGPLRPGS